MPVTEIVNHMFIVTTGARHFSLHEYNLNKLGRGSNCFPDKWKEAKVSPLHKNGPIEEINAFMTFCRKPFRRMRHIVKYDITLNADHSSKLRRKTIRRMYICRNIVESSSKIGRKIGRKMRIRKLKYLTKIAQCSCV